LRTFACRTPNGSRAPISRPLHYASAALRFRSCCARPVITPAIISRLLAIEYLDARGPDGAVRKYRVVCVDGVLYPVHVAIAAQWKAHYFSADMADRPDYRAEEARFLANMNGVLGEPGIRALQTICATLNLDYCGVDFGRVADGTLLVFEANATMAVTSDDVVAAVRAMLVSRARERGYPSAVR
jgi:hypothetical protein